MPSDFVDYLRGVLQAPQGPLEAQKAIDRILISSTKAFEGYDFTGWPLDRVVFPPGTSLRNTVFSGNKANHIVVSGCDLTGSKWRGVTARSAVFFEAVLDNTTIDAGSDFTCGDFSNAVVRDGVISGSSFNQARFDGTDFEGSRLTSNQIRESDLSAARLGRSVFIDNDFRGTKFDPNACNSALVSNYADRTAGARFEANWYNRSGRLPTVPEVHADAFRHRLTSRFLGTTVQTGIGFFIERGFDFIQDGFHDIAANHAIPGSQIAVGTLVLFGLASIFDDRVREATLGGVMKSSGAVRMAAAAAAEYCRQRAGLVAVVGSRAASRNLRLALIAARRSWAPDPFADLINAKFAPSYRLFAAADVSIIVCGKSHLAQAIRILQHTAAPTVRETLIIAPDADTLPLGVPGAIGVTATHQTILAFNAPDGPKGEQRSVAAFFGSDGGLLRVERVPVGDWNIPNEVYDLVLRGAAACTERFISVGRLEHTQRSLRFSLEGSGRMHRKVHFRCVGKAACRPEPNTFVQTQEAVHREP
jgi:uncharacterized protein YjbI with pentapeptide repeats